MSIVVGESLRKTEALSAGGVAVKNCMFFLYSSIIFYEYLHIFRVENIRYDSVVSAFFRKHISLLRSIMKKYIGVYMVLFSILLFIFLTGGISQGIILDKYDFSYASDGVKGTTIFLIHNVIISLVCMIACIISACMKENRTRLKWIIPVVMLILIVLFLSIVYKSQTGGITGRPNENFYTLLEYSKI